MVGLLRQIGQQQFASRFYLAGGTALALQLGHRRSEDLDFFSELDQVKPDTHQEILRALDSLNPQVMEKAFGNFVLSIGGTSVGFFGYGYPLVGQGVSVENVALASLFDIGLMKMDALASRGSRKDFYDLYFVAQQISLEELLEKSTTKYPHFRDFPLMFLKYVVLFDNADRDVQPELLISVEWSAVKEFFVNQVRQLSQSRFGL
jgi:predicted nucleotidyltransferase component of viral defense system